MKLILEHKVQAILCLIAVILFICFSVFAYTSNHAGDPQENPATSDMTEEELAAKEAESNLTSEQLALRDSYGEQEETFISILCGSDWMVDNQLPSMSFNALEYAETDSNLNTTVVAYVISDLQVEQRTTSSKISEVFTAAVETSKKQTIIIKLVAEENLDGSDKKFTLTSNGFLDPENAYTQATAQKTFNVTGLNSDMSNYIGSSLTDLQEQMKVYCAAYVPTASEATWGKEVYIDYANGELTTYFDLNDRNATTITVVYNMTDKTFDIKK